MYRNAVYIPKDQKIRLFHWDEDGKRVVSDLSYQPYLYQEIQSRSADSTDKVSIFNTPLKRKTFRNAADRSRFVRSIGSDRIFENIQPVQQFLLDTFWQVNDNDDFSMYPLRMMFFDIETYSPDAFPNYEDPTDEINIITVYDTLTRSYTTWGLGEFRNQQEGVTYIRCKDEKDLLRQFIEWIHQNPPDVLSGWNSEFFDIPYTVERIRRVLGASYISRLSPVGNVYYREVQGQFGQMQRKYTIEGIACVDYIDIYKRFSMGERESYKLDAIGEYELGEKKVSYGSTNLSGLADDNWQLFTEYNIQDVRLLTKLEDKLRYLELLRMLSYIGLCSMEAAMGTLTIVTGAAVIEARRKGQIVPTIIDPSNSQKFEGAYVGDPIRGFNDNVVSFDVNSLYPNVMISLNLSPETKVGKIIRKTDEELTIRHVNGQTFKLTPKGLRTLMDKEQLAISRAGVLFHQKKKGIFPEIVDKYYGLRVKVKDNAKKKQKQIRALKKKEKEDETGKVAKAITLLESEVTRADLRQLAIKIYINSVYGYFGNKYSPMGDSDISRSITLTGQGVIKQSNQVIRKYIADKCGASADELESKSPIIIYNDTDSVYASVTHLLDHGGYKLCKPDSYDITENAYSAIGDLEDHLNAAIIKWGEDELNSKDCRFQFKREVICDTGLFLQKKRYVLHKIDDEGIPMDKFKYTGVDVVRSTLPAALKPHIKKVIETMIRTKSLPETNAAYMGAYAAFKDLPINDISNISGVHNFDKWADASSGLRTAKSMPKHVKAAYFYNQMLKRFSLEKAHEPIGTGDKVRFYDPIIPNQYGISVIGYKYDCPKEIAESLPPNREGMFQRLVHSIIEGLFEAVKWPVCKPNAVLANDLTKLFGA